MRFLLSNFQALLALSFALGSQAHPYSRNSLVKRYGAYDATSNCQPFKNDEDAKNLWDDSLAGVIGDDFINENGVENWAQDLDEKIFHEPQNSWLCQDPFTKCEVDKTCSEFADKGFEGAHYLFLSLQNAIGVLRSAHSYLVENAVKEHLNVPRITETFGKEASDADPNMMILASTTFAMIGGATAAIPPLTGAAGFAAGMFAFTGNVDPPKAGKTKDFEGKLDQTVLKSFAAAEQKVGDIIGALVGEKGKNQDTIPKEMMKQSFDNPVINALSEGQWLSKDPGEGVEERIETAYTRNKQRLVWTMIRYGRKGFFYVDAGAPKDKCGDGEDDRPEEFWHDDADGCVKLMEVEKDEDGPHFVYTPQDINDKIWGNDDDYNLDVKETFQNAYDCWVDNDGKVGEVDLKDQDFSDELALPKCWFGIPVVRASEYESPVAEVDDHLELEEFPGHENGLEWKGDFNEDGSLA